MSMILMLESLSEDEAKPDEEDRDIIPMSAYEMFPSVSALRGESENALSLEKAWHGLHFLLTGDPWGGSGPRAFLLASGTPHGEELGYGPARLIDAEEVQEIAAELQTITNDELWTHYNSSFMLEMGIYPEIWDEPEEDLKEEYCGYFEDLQQFVAKAAKDGNCLRITMM